MSLTHTTMSKMRCRYCANYCYDYLDGRYESDSEPFCGLHGRARVDPDGKQQNLDSRGGCGYIARQKPVQLEIKWE